MNFASLDFIVFFLIVISTVALLKYRKFQHVFLLLSSYFFFYFSSNYLIILLIFTTIWDFYFGHLIYRSKELQKKKIILLISLAGNLGLLGFFKYADFVITQFNFLGQQLDLGTQIPLLHLALPIAISFYTFHSITYTISIYRNQMKPAKSFIEYAIFVSFFPQLVAGPILRAKEFLPQLREKINKLNDNSIRKLITISSTNLKYGITLMAFGFLKKMFFADNIAPFVNDVFVNPLGAESFTVILGVIAFGFQIYGDFSGYSDIAIGAALIMGLKIPINFNKPYFANSPSDFWRRWHISLSTWLRDYFYISLGGNRKSQRRTYLNLMIVMFFGGLWHGASINFIIWGILHGTYLALHRLILNKMPRLGNNAYFKTTGGKILSILITQYLIFLTWIAFRVQNLEYLYYSMQKYVFLDFRYDQTLEMINTHKISIIVLCFFIILNYITFRKPNIRERISNASLPYWIVFLVLVILGILLLYDGNPEDFIYFKF